MFFVVEKASLTAEKEYATYHNLLIKPLYHCHYDAKHYRSTSPTIWP